LNKRILLRRRIINLCIVLALLIIFTGIKSASGSEKVTLQLRWFHQFQFAGYYAALEKGFYADEGLEVRIEQGGEGRDPVKRVLSGEADFGVTNSEILLHRLKGQTLVVVAVIFQHSPLILLTYANSHVYTPQDLVGRRVMMMPGTRDVEILAMLQSEGIPFESIRHVEAKFRVEDYLDKSISAHSAYITNQPYYLKEKKFPFRIIYPAKYGIDFYGDCLFTSERMVHDNPELVKRFRKASLAGWDYAMSNKEEIIQLIISKYKTWKSDGHLRFEAEQMEKLILSGVIETGHINPGRWKQIADTFVKLGMIRPGYSLDGFIFNPDPAVDYRRVRNMVIFFVLSIFGISAIAIVLLAFNRKLQNEIAEHLITENRLKESNLKLENTLDEVKTLRGIVPICANCKKIRDDEGFWHEVEEYISTHSEAELSHSLCSDCLKLFYPQSAGKDKK